MIALDELTEKQKLRYDRILNFSAEIIFRDGFHRLSLDDITKQLKISKSTIYENFGSKDGLVEKVVELFGERLDQGLDEILKDRSLSTCEKFMAVARKQGDAVASNRFMQDMIIHAPHLHERYEEGRMKREERCYEPLIRKGMREGLFDKRLNADFLLQVYTKMGQLACTTDMVERSSVSKIDAMDALIRIFLNGSKNMDLE